MLTDNLPNHVLAALNQPRVPVVGFRPLTAQQMDEPEDPFEDAFASKNADPSFARLAVFEQYVEAHHPPARRRVLPSPGLRRRYVA